MLSEFPAAKRLLEEKGRQILTKMGMLEETALVDGLEEEEKMKRKVDQLEDSLNALHTKLARLMAELEASAYKMLRRMDLLEKEAQVWVSPEDRGEEGRVEAEGQNEGEDRKGGGKGEGMEEPEEQRVESGKGGEAQVGEGAAGEREVKRVAKDEGGTELDGESSQQGEASQKGVGRKPGGEEEKKGEAGGNVAEDKGQKGEEERGDAVRKEEKTSKK